MMKTTKKSFILTFGTILVSILTLVMLSIGCSTDNNIAGPQSNEYSSKEAHMTGPDFILPPGLELVTGLKGKTSENVGSLDGGTRPPNGPNGTTRPPAPLSASMFMEAELGGTVSCQFVGCSIPAGALPYDAEITATLSNPSSAIVDFGPHPLQFNMPVMIWFNIAQLNVNSDTENLAMWYVAEDGTLEPIPLTIDQNLAIGYTNHFSRYILTRTNG
jgi:hypothetical protein